MSKVVPLERKVYDFVPVRVRDNEDGDWLDAELYACLGNTNQFPYRAIIKGTGLTGCFKYCEFI